MEYSLIANTGIQLFTFPIRIPTQEKFKLYYHEWYDTTQGQWRLDPVYVLKSDGCTAYYNKKLIRDKGYLNIDPSEIDLQILHDDGVNPLRIDNENCAGIKGEIYHFSLNDPQLKLNLFEGEWLPLPYFFKRSERRLSFRPFNWSRAKFILKKEEKGYKEYDVVLAFDTRAGFEPNEYNEYPIFPDRFRPEMEFKLCDDEFMLMDFCSSGQYWSYVNDYLFELTHPNIQRNDTFKRNSGRKMDYIASYALLVSYLAQKKIFPTVKLYKDTDLELQNVDMIVDIGNSKTTVLLIEDNSTFNQVRQLTLQDYTQCLTQGEPSQLTKYTGPFDMRLVFRKAQFGPFGIKDSKQFIYPSLIRLGGEAKSLIHHSTNRYEGVDTLSTNSSPKRFLWDDKPNKEEWRYMVLPNETDDTIINLKGISQYLKSDGTLDRTGNGGISFHYSRRSLMTFSFLEMLLQARTQINSFDYRSEKTGLGRPNMPRRIKRIIVTCPTAMSALERTNLTKSAKDAVFLLNKFYYEETEENLWPKTEVIPMHEATLKEGQKWYYDEATCAQLVYMYGEVGQKYKGFASEFFDLYGKYEGTQSTLTLASLDIGAGTSDLMISKYTCTKGNVTTITPNPIFYDSYYFAGDDMLKALIKNIMLLNELTSAFRQQLNTLSSREYRQTIKNFFGPDYSGQTFADRVLRKNFNLQYAVPLMHHYLQLLADNSENCQVRYEDVFHDCPPSEEVIAGFREKMGIDVTTLEWYFNKDEVEKVVRDEFEPLLKKIATIMYAHAADIILLSGRPASLSVIRELFLKYYSVSPNRLIVLNNYYVGDWYPFSKNTGYIANPKTIVAMGGAVAYYASELSNLDRFTINLEKLNDRLCSTINYVESTHEGETNKYLITPEKTMGELVITSLPEVLNIRQLGIKAYPSRPLYAIDFNRHQIQKDIQRRYEKKYCEVLTDSKAFALVNDEIDELKKSMPFTVSIERDPEEKEKLYITQITDKEGNEIADSYIEIHIQSLGIDEKYWLDSGAFEF